MDRPMIFSGPMVRALLDGRKSQTRRVLNPQPQLLPAGDWHVFNSGGGCVGLQEIDVPKAAIDYQRYEAGDRLWVRETWAQQDRGALYRADPHYDGMSAGDFAWAWRPSIHMPRWASRLTLTVTDVRVQRLEDISEEDARAEGVERNLHPVLEDDGTSYIDAFGDLWDTINAKRPGCTWADNPWVAALTFTVHRGNIDQVTP